MVHRMTFSTAEIRCSMLLAVEVPDYNQRKSAEISARHFCKIETFGATLVGYGGEILLYG